MSVGAKQTKLGSVVTHSRAWIHSLPSKLTSMSLPS